MKKIGIYSMVLLLLLTIGLSISNALTYAVLTTNGVFKVDGLTPIPTNAIWPIPSELLSVPDKYLKSNDGKTLQEANAAEKIIIDSNIVAQAELARQAAENVWQLNKSIQLKSLENMYVKFLTNEWTTVLRQYTVIPSTNTITVANTTSLQNINYLLQLRAMDTNITKNVYVYFKGELSDYRDNIERMGGSMDKVIYHSEIP
jgi:hypothetical protein